MKDFLKQISIYGILPVAGKFAGFFLIPVYTRLFSSAEFGMLELLMTLIKFLLFACNLEFYNAIGRYFYEKESLDWRKSLISTGLFLTVITSIIIAIGSFLFKDEFYKFYLNSFDFQLEFKLCLVWLFMEAIFTYLSVIPRFEKKPKTYVAISVSALFIRIASTILYVLVMDLGIAGVIYGHITGAIISLLLYSFASRKYLSFHFSYEIAKKITKFAVPIVPGLLLIGFWGPLSRNLIAKYYSLEFLGLFAFAIRIASVMEILNGAIRMAWNPLIFENFNKPNFKKDTQNISRLMGILAIGGASGITLLAPEISTYIGTEEYDKSALLIGFLCLTGIVEILKRLRGFGPLISNKTGLLTLAEAVGMILGIAMLIQFQNLGLLGIGIAFLVSALVKYFILTNYTVKKMNIAFNHWNDVLLFSFSLISLGSVYFEVLLVFRSILFLITIGTCIYMLREVYGKKTRTI